MNNQDLHKQLDGNTVKIASKNHDGRDDKNWKYIKNCYN